jgi:hypothetical protein
MIVNGISPPQSGQDRAIGVDIRPACRGAPTVGFAEPATQRARRRHHHRVDIFDPDDDLLLGGVVDPGPTLAELFEMTDPPPATGLDLGEWWL